MAMLALPLLAFAGHSAAAAQPPACSFTLPDSSAAAGCVQFDLSPLPKTTFLLNDSCALILVYKIPLAMYCAACPRARLPFDAVHAARARHAPGGTSCL